MPEWLEMAAQIPLTPPFCLSCHAANFPVYGTPDDKALERNPIPSPVRRSLLRPTCSRRLTNSRPMQRATGVAISTTSLTLLPHEVCVSGMNKDELSRCSLSLTVRSPSGTAANLRTISPGTPAKTPAPCILRTAQEGRPGRVPCILRTNG